MMGAVVRLRPKTPKREEVKLTKRYVEAIKVSRTELTIRDRELRGFGVRVMPSGVVSYFCQYRDKAGRTRKVALGRHGAVTVEQARSAAKQHLAAVARGENPSADRQRERFEARNARTVSEILDALVAHAEIHRKASTAKFYRETADRYIVPDLGDLPAADLTFDRVQQWHSAMVKTPYCANRALAALSAAYGRARLSNPCAGVERFREHARDRFYSIEELQRIGKVLDAGERERTILPGVVDCIRLLALTGCRLSEILGLRWQDVDLDGGRLRLPDAKAGARNVPLGEDALALLAAIPREGEYVVRARRAGQRMPLSTVEDAWRRIREAAKLESARLHDLRHTVGTFAGAAGLNAFTVRDLLGHKTLSMTSRYVSADANPLRRAVNTAVAPIAAAMAGKEALGDPE